MRIARGRGVVAPESRLRRARDGIVPLPPAAG
jgi:hypothetical protein